MSPTYKEICGVGERTVPCGKCAGCIRSRQNSWFIRARNEVLSLRPMIDGFNTAFKDNERDNPCQAWFVTLTYDDEHITTSHTYKDPWGYDTPVYTLNYKNLSDHFHTFNKWYRRNHSTGFSYFGCGEYGTRFHRPHYHILFVGICKSAIIKFCLDWQDKFCPKSKEVRNGFCVVDGSFKGSGTVGVVCEHIPLFSFEDHDNASDVSKVCRYVAKYAAKSTDSWYQRSQFSGTLQKPKLFSSRFFGHGITPCRSFRFDLLKIALADKLDIQALSLFERAGVPYDDNGQMNIDFLRSLSSSLVQSVNGFPYKMPQYIYNSLFTKDYYPGEPVMKAHKFKVPVILDPKLPKFEGRYYNINYHYVYAQDSRFLKRTAVDYRQVIPKLVKPYSEADSFREGVPVCYALSSFRQAETMRLLADCYNKWLYNHPGHERKESPVLDSQFLSDYYDEEQSKNEVLNESRLRSDVKYYQGSIL